MNPLLGAYFMGERFDRLIFMGNGKKSVFYQDTTLRILFIWLVETYLWYFWLGYILDKKENNLILFWPLCKYHMQLLLILCGL